MTAIRAAFKAYRMHQVLIMPRFARLTIAWLSNCGISR